MILISEDLREALASAATRLLYPSPCDAEQLSRVREAAAGCSALVDLAKTANSILDEQGYVQVVGLPKQFTRPLFLGLVTLIGKVFIDPSEGSAVIGAHVRPQQHLMGNQVRALPLHTDYSMMALPPRLTTSLCMRTDKISDLGSLLVADVEAMCFGLDGDDDVSRFKSIALPFAARNASDELEVINCPIISTQEDGRVIVRYHRSRIVQGFRHLQQSPSSVQATTMRAFERWVREAACTLTVEEGTVLVLDNHRMAHGRNRCSVELSLDGTTQGRQMLFIFAH